VVIGGERFGPIKIRLGNYNFFFGRINNIMQTHVEGDNDFLIF
jgi:hypothetical protein